jgi:SPP1 family predicted phage head-tail adaptor|nr:MAG TPA: Putative head tail adaptor [Caudoviricetes sp.]
MLNISTKPHNLKHTVLFQRSTLGKDVDGKPTYIWTDIYQTRCHVRSTVSNEFIQGNGEDVKIDKTIVIRLHHKHTLAENDIAIIKGIRYNIKSVVDIQDEHEWLEIKLAKVRT